VLGEKMCPSKIEILDDIAEQHSKEEFSYWLKAKREAKLEGIKCLEDAAKQVIIITSLLQGIYFAAISFSDVKNIINMNNNWFIIFIILSLFVLLCWMTSLFFATRVFMPKKYNKEIYAEGDGDELEHQVLEIQRSFTEIINFKYSNLYHSFILLWASFPLLAANILIFLLLIYSNSDINIQNINQSQYNSSIQLNIT
jgi:hypothetical protein